MQFNYTFPAMTTVLRRSAAQSAICIVKGETSARIEEISSFEAPVAATISLRWRDGGQPFRFHDGRFYIAAKGGMTGAMRHVDGLVMSSMCDHLLRSRRQAAAIQPREIRGQLWGVWSHGRGLPPESYLDDAVPDWMFEPMKEFDPRRHDVEAFEYWRAHTEDLVSQLRIIDGVLWRPTPEPILRWSVGGSGSRWEFDDINVFSLRTGRSKSIPAPYGKGGLPGFLGNMIETIRYWRSDYRNVSLPEADRLTDAYRANRDFNVILPEAFTADIFAEEINRAARIAVASMKRELDKSVDGDFIRRDEDLAYHYKSLLKLTSGASGFRTPDELEDPLLAFRNYTTPQDSVKSPYHCGRKFADRTGVGPLVGDILERWQSRDVDIDFAPPSNRPKP